MNKSIKVLAIIFGGINFLIILSLVLCKCLFKNEIIKLFDKNNLNYISYSLYSDNDVLVSLFNNTKIDSSYLDDYDVKEVSREDLVDNPYEEEILINNSEDIDYKYIKTSVNGYDAYLVVIYDPSKVKLITSSAFNTGNSQETVLNICNRVNGKVCINGGGFVDYGSGSDTPIGYIIKDSKIVWSDSRDNNAKESLIGFDNNNELKLINASGNEALEMGIRDALQFGPFLIVNGEDIDLSHDMTGGYSGASRVAIGQRKDGIVLFLVTDGRHGKGPTLSDVQSTFKLYGVYNAANLDGGASSQLVISGSLINKPINIYGEQIYGGRKVVSGFGLINE